MKKYIIMVEGAHDLGVIGKLLVVLGYKKAKEQKDLSKELDDILPKKFPFTDGRLDRITPIPDFYCTDGKEVLLIMANGETNIFRSLDKNLRLMSPNKEALKKIEKVIIFIDSDAESDRKKKIDELIEGIKTKEVKILDKTKLLNEKKVNLGIKEIDIHFYCFPNDRDAGVLEDIILKSLDITYGNEILEQTEKYVEYIENKKINEVLGKGNSSKKKALVSCIGNTIIEPSVSGTVYINDSDWVEKTISENLELEAIKDYLDDKLQ